MEKTKKKNVKLFLFISIIMAVSVILLNLAETSVVVETTQAKIKEENTNYYKELANSYANNIATHLDMYFGHLDLYVKSDTAKNGSTDQIKDWLLRHEGDRDEEFSYVAYADQNGDFHSDINTHVNITDRDYWQAMMRGEEYFIDNPVHSKISGKSVIHICRPIDVKVNGKPKGFMAAVVESNSLSVLLDNVDLGKDGVAILFDGNGNPMASNVSESRMRELTSDQRITDEFGRQMSIQGEKGSFYCKTMIGDTLLIFEPVEYTPWKVIMMIPASQVYKSTSSGIGWMMTIGGVILAILLISIIGTILYRSLKPLSVVEKNIVEIASGDADLTKRIDINSNNEIGRVVDGFNGFTEKLQDIVSNLKNSKNTLVSVGDLLTDSTHDTSSAITQIISNIQSMENNINAQNSSVHETAGAVNEIASNIESLNRMIEGQASAVTQASAAVEEMIGNINSVNHSVQKMAVAFTDLEQKAVIGVQKQEAVNNKISVIEAESQSLQEANSVISSIAEQTNLLAMNAAIEAAHAGEAGKGFSVVADEIRKLSETSSSQSRTIGEELKKITDEINNIVAASKEASDAFSQVSNGINGTNNLVLEIKNAMDEQEQGSKQISEALNNMNDTSNQVKSSSFEMAEGNKAILSEVQKLQDASLGIKNGMEEMSVGARKINETGAALSDLSMQMKDSISAIGEQVDKFKV